METETSKNKRGRVFIGVIMGLAVGFIIGFIFGINTSPMKVIWIIIGLVCLLIVVIGFYWLFRSGQKKE